MTKWYNNKLLANLLLILIFPIGLYALWKSDNMAKWWKVTATLILSIILVIYLGPYDDAPYQAPTYDIHIHEKIGLAQHQIEVNNCQINYWIKDNDNENWVVFLHGAGQDHRMFLEQANALANTYNLLLIDGRGQGKSKLIDPNKKVVFSDMITDVIQVLNTLKIEEAIIIAQSLGASLAQEIAFRHPTRVGKMVLIGCYNHHEKTGSAWKFKNLVTTTALRVVPWKTAAKKFGEMTSKDTDVQNYTIECLLTSGRETWKNLGLSAYEEKHQVNEYTKPHETLLIRGENDYPQVLAGIYSRMKEINPLAHEVVISNAGHTCNMENTADVNNAILRFIE